MTNVEKALMPPAIAILQADDLSFRHATPRSPLLFDRLSIAVRPGVTWVCGDEGTGKSTLLRLLASALPASGNLYLNGVSLAHDPAGYQRQVAWMDPRDTALDRQTARQIFADLPHQHPDCDRQALQTHLGGLSLAPHLDKTLQMMST